jgi:filamentous hemagglutinin
MSVSSGRAVASETVALTMRPSGSTFSAQKGLIAPRIPTPGAAKSGGVRLSQKGLNLVENHLAKFGDDAANAGMMQNLQNAFSAGQTVTGANANFYLHEASEATMMGRGLSYDAAHAAALQKYGVSPFSLYAPNVIQANPTLFNNAWRARAGLPPLP